MVPNAGSLHSYSELLAHSALVESHHINMHEGDIVKMVDIYTCRQAVRGARSTTEMYPATYITLIMINLINHKCKQ